MTGFFLILIFIVDAAFVGLNGWILATGHGGPLNAVALAVCAAGGIYALVSAARL